MPYRVNAYRKCDDDDDIEIGPVMFRALQSFEPHSPRAKYLVFGVLIALTVVVGIAQWHP